MARGYNALADVLKTTVDGQDLNSIWAEHQGTLQIRNQHRQALVDLIAAPTTLSAEEIAQTSTDYNFELATEFGVPTSLRGTPSTIKLGFPIEDYDAATRYTWQFLAHATSQQIVAIHSAALEADNRLLFTTTMSALLTKTTAATRTVNEDGVQIVSLWDGEADARPPSIAGVSFAAGHTHYLTSGANVVDGGDLAALVTHVTHHGFGRENGDQMIVLCNPNEGGQIRSLRANVTVNGVVGPWDFIPSSDAPAYLTDQTIVGTRAPGEFRGLKVIGSYGDAWVVEDAYVPAGYLVAVAVGAQDTRAPLAFREDVRAELRGLLELPGDAGARYPLLDAFYYRRFGVGVRQRGAASVMQVTTSATYANPVVIG